MSLRWDLSWGFTALHLAVYVLLHRFCWSRWGSSDAEAAAEPV